MATIDRTTPLRDTTPDIKSVSHINIKGNPKLDARIEIEIANPRAQNFDLYTDIRTMKHHIMITK